MFAEGFETPMLKVDPTPISNEAVVGLTSAIKGVAAFLAYNAASDGGGGRNG